MASPITPKPRTGPARAYDEAIEARKRKAAEWLGLDPAAIWDFVYGGLGATWNSEKRVGLRPGPLDAAARFDEHPSYDGERYTISYAVTLRWEDAEALREHLGPPPEPPQFISLWNARAEDLTPGALLYDAQGNVVGEVGDVVRGTGRQGGVAFGIFDG